MLGRQRGQLTEIVLARHRADADRVTFEVAFEGADAIQIDQVRGVRETQFHHRQQAVSAGKQLRFSAMGRQERQCRIDRSRGVIFERTRNHL